MKKLEKMWEFIAMIIIGGVFIIINIIISSYICDSYNDDRRLRYEVLLMRPSNTVDTVQCYDYHQIDERVVEPRFITSVSQPGDRVLIDEIIQTDKYGNRTTTRDVFQILPRLYSINRNDTIGYEKYSYGNQRDSYTRKDILLHNKANPSKKIDLQPTYVVKRLYGIVLSTHYQKTDNNNLWLDVNKREWYPWYQDDYYMHIGIICISIFLCFHVTITKLAKQIYQNILLVYNRYKTRKSKN